MPDPRNLIVQICQGMAWGGGEPGFCFVGVRGEFGAMSAVLKFKNEAYLASSLWSVAFENEKEDPAWVLSAFCSLLIRFRLGALRRSASHRTCNFRKNLADIGGHPRHDRAGSHGNKASHQGVFNQVLALRIFQDLEC